MRRSGLGRVFAAVDALWLVAVRSKPAAFHECAMHDGAAASKHHHAPAVAALFRMDVSSEQTVNPLMLVATNGGSSRRQGLEVNIRVPVTDNPIASGNWTFNDARYTSVATAADDGSAVPLNGLQVFNTSKYVGVAALEIAPRGSAARVRVSGNWVGPYGPFDEPGVVTGGYGLMHRGASAPVARLEIDAGVRNLLDRAYPELIAGHIVSPGQLRTLYVSVRARM
jgi:outer membrane receptor protein involved in Fe transport